MIKAEDLERIEEALNIKLYDNVIKSLITDEEVKWDRRIMGKTTAYMIKLALNIESISYKDLMQGRYSDECRSPNYDMWFRYEFLKVRKLLQNKGFKVVELRRN